MTAPARAGILPGRFGSGSRNSDGLAHLLPSTLPDPSRRTTPALCGQPRMKWLPVDEFPVGTVLTDCAECTARATDRPELAAPVRIVPPARHGTVAPPHTPVDVDNSQAARTSRRRDFRRSFHLARDARGYIPRPYANPETEERVDV